MSESKRIGSILVCGSGPVGLSAAVAFARALPQAKVRLLALAADPAALADRMPGTLPSVRFFHRLIGLDEPRLVRQAGATHRIGTRFDHWSADGEPWFHCFGRYGAAMRASPFRHQWARMRNLGRALNYDHYAPVTAIARADKFVHPPDDQNSLLSSFDYALRLDPRLYAGVLMDEAVRARVELREGEIGEVRHRPDGMVVSVVLTDGTDLQADLFIDCAGPAAPLLSSVEPEFDDWSESLPCDHVLIGRSDSGRPSPVDLATATTFGWRMSIPLQSGSMICGGFSSTLADGDEAEREFRAATRLEQVQAVAIRPGRRRNSWVGNVVAFGDAAVAFDPLEAANLSLAQSAIRRAVSLLPNTDFLPLLLDEFNRQTRVEAERVRDFIAVHYLASKNIDGPFWKAMPERERPASLRHTLEQFEGRARLPKYEEETFDEDSWLSVLFGLGIMPRRVDPTAYRIDEDEASGMMDRIARMSAALPAQLPTYPDYLARMIKG
jgi:tryptophan halogenase